jgi:hypothetical protein
MAKLKRLLGAPLWLAYPAKSAFTLARFRGQFRTKFAHLVVKKNIFLNKNVLA